MSQQKNLPVVDWLEIFSSAPGKFIISGEYSVVYERQAIAAAIDLRTNVTIRPNNDGVVRLKLNDLQSYRAWPTSTLTANRLVAKNSCLEYNDSMPGILANLLNTKYYTDSSGNPLKDNGDNIKNQPTSISENGDKTERKDLNKKKADDAVIAFLLLYMGIGDSFCNSARLPIDVNVESSVPVGSGLGSSSAYSVALCGGLMKVFLASAEKYIISNWAFNIDKFFHGSPSGVDNNVVSVGGYILFQNGKIKATGTAHEAPVRVMLIDTKVSRSTRALCETVVAKLRESPGTISTLFTTINEITSMIWFTMNAAGFSPRLIASHLSANQHYLNELGVGHEKLTDICERADKQGLTAKQTGAGGGGIAFVLYDASEDQVKVDKLREELVASGYDVHDHSVGCKGLTVKVVPDPEKRFKPLVTH